MSSESPTMSTDKAGDTGTIKTYSWEDITHHLERNRRPLLKTWGPHGPPLKLKISLHAATLRRQLSGTGMEKGSLYEGDGILLYCEKAKGFVFSPPPLE